MAQLCQHLGKIGRQGALHGDPLPGAGVDKGEPSGVKALARQAGDGLLGPVYHVPQQGVADGGQMHPDLVGAAGLQTALNMGIAGEALQHRPVGHRRTAVFPIHAHLLPVGGVAADGRVHSAAVLPQAAHAHRLVLPVKGVILELGGQGLVGIVVLGGNEQPRCVPVDAVDDAGAEGSVDSGE